MFAIHKFPSRNIDYPDADRNKICRMEWGAYFSSKQEKDRPASPNSGEKQQSSSIDNFRFTKSVFFPQKSTP